MKELPILFSTPMVQAILAGTKTQTRRVVKDQSSAKVMDHGHEWERLELQASSHYGNPGDLLYVREIFINDGDETNPVYVFKADNENYPRNSGCSWKPSIHMPKDAARIWLQIESIRIERLNDISEEDAKAEGIEQPRADSFWKNYLSKDGATFYNPVDSYQSLWNSINGPDSWNTNPWVWVITFKVLSTTGKPTDLKPAGSLSNFKNLMA